MKSERTSRRGTYLNIPRNRGTNIPYFVAWKRFAERYRFPNGGSMLADSSPFFFFYFWTFDIGISRNHARVRSKLEPRRNKSIRERKFRKFRKSIF